MNNSSDAPHPHITISQQLIEEAKLFQAHALLHQQEHKTFHSHPLYHETKRKTQLSKKILQMIQESQDWTDLGFSGGVTGKYFAPDDLPLHCFVISSMVKVPMFNVVAVVYEVDLFHQWMPGLHSSSEIARVNRFEKVVKLEYNFPVFSNREVILEAFGVHCVEDDALLIALQSIDEHPEIDIPPVANNKVRAEMNISGYYIEPISEEDTRVTMIMNLDPKMDAVSPWLMNMATGKILQWFFYYMEQAAQFDEESIYHERILADPDVYEHIRNVLSK